MKFRGITKILGKTGQSGASMRTRLFAFLFALVLVMISTFVTIFIITGGHKAGANEVRKFVNLELGDIHSYSSQRLGDIAVRVVSLSQALSGGIEAQLGDMAADTLQSRPELLEGILSAMLDRIQLELERTGASGVFVVLDATVNPALEYAGQSRAGIYIRNPEPQVAGQLRDSYLYIRGFPRIALQNNMYMQASWDMEFDVAGRAFFQSPLEKYSELFSGGASLPLSRLYYWGMDGVIPEQNEPALVCSIPIISSNGIALGVCGFEISAWNFSNSCSLHTNEYKDAFCVFGQLGEDALRSVMASEQAYNGGAFSISSSNSGELNYYAQGILEYVGLHRAVQLYPGDSVFGGEYAVAVLLPKESIDALARGNIMLLIATCAALLVVGAGVAYFICRKHLRPIESALENPDAKTNIFEIDMLIERIKEMHQNNQHPENQPGLAKTLTPAEIEELKLSPREKTVASFLLQGLSMRQIAGNLGIKESTVNGYMKSLYSKLSINSRAELFARFGVINYPTRTSRDT